MSEKLKAQAKSTKFQTPNSKEASSSKLEARAAVWSLELGISLVFGAWFLVFRFRDFSGAWGLVLGVSLSGSSKTEMIPIWRRRTLGGCNSSPNRTDSPVAF